MATRRALFVLLLLPLNAFQIRVWSPPRLGNRRTIRGSTLLEEAPPVTVTPTVTVVTAAEKSECAAAAEKSASAAESEGPKRRATLALIVTSLLWGTYPTAMKLLFAAEGAPLSAPVITAARFALMAIAAQGVLMWSGGPAAAPAADAGWDLDGFEVGSRSE